MSEYKLHPLSLISILLASFLLVWPALGFSNQAAHNMLELRDEVYDWVEQQLREEQLQRYQIELSTTQGGLRLPNCEEALQVEPHGRAELRGRVNLRVACAEQGWFIYVTANITVYTPVVIARTALPRQTQLTRSMLELREMDVSRLRGNYYTRIEDLVGFRLRSRVNEGVVLTDQQLIASHAVNRGDQVVIHAIGSQLQVRMQGEALDNGQVGDQVRVRNLQSGRTIRARVAARGVVEVHF